MKVRMVSAGIYEELAIVSCFFLVGIFLAASYDILRMFRAFVPHGIFWINLEESRPYDASPYQSSWKQTPQEH